MLRKVTATLNGLVVLTSLALFSYTFFASSHLTEKARDFVTEKTLSHSQPLIDLADQGLKSPLLSKLLTAEQKTTIKTEVHLYQQDPADYVQKLTANQTESLDTGKAVGLKEKIRAYYQTTLSQLIKDLRIFSGSNIVAGLIALGLLFRKKFGTRRSVIAFSFIIFAAVAVSSYYYVDGMGFFSILFKWHLGWWYPAGIIITIISMCLKHGLHKEADDQPAPAG